MRILIILSVLIGLSFNGLLSQESTVGRWQKISNKYGLKTSLGFQLWSTYTIDQQVYDQEQDRYLAVDDRWNNELRRSRLTFSGQPYEGLSFKLTASLDLVGRDALSATQGGNNNGTMGQFGLWNFWFRWKPVASSDLLHVTFGFQSPQIGRESITAALRSTSFEKSWSQNYLRRNIVGTGPGRVLGVNFGGQKNLLDKVTFSYDIGFYTPQKFSIVSNSQGVATSPLKVGRFAFHFGDPESQNYSTSHKINYFGKRNGLTLALAASHQGTTDVFDDNSSIGFDYLLNYRMLNFDGEWTWFRRSKASDENTLFTSSNGGYTRLGYNIKLKHNRFLEPVIMIARYEAPLTYNQQQDALALKAFAGTDHIIDLGVNYHLNSDLKVSLSYTANHGQSGDAPEGSTFNNYFRDSNKEPIKRGNLLGLAMVAIF